MSALSVRPYRERDEDVVTSLWREVFAGDPSWNEPRGVIARKLRVGRDLFLVGELDGKVVATIVTGYDGFRGWLYHLAVAPGLRRRGYGRLMVEEAERRLRSLGCVKVNLQVRGSNEEAVSFYRHLGYGLEERLSMGKRLSEGEDTEIA